MEVAESIRVHGRRWQWTCLGAAIASFAPAAAIAGQITVEAVEPPIAWTVPAAKGAVFLTRVRLADPEYRLILMAGFKQHELSLLLNRHTRPEEVPLLLKGLAGMLGKEFRGQEMSVIAFWPEVPLRTAGTATVSTAGSVNFFEANR